MSERLSARRVPSLLDFTERRGLSGLAIAQPTLDLLTKNPQLFIAWRASVWGLLVLLLAIVIVPPLVAWLLVSIVRLFRHRPAEVAQGIAVGAFVALLVAGVLRKVDA